MSTLGRNVLIEKSDLYALGITILNGVYPFL